LFWQACSWYWWVMTNVQSHAFIACRGCQALASSKSIPPLPPCSEHKYKSNVYWITYLCFIRSFQVQKFYPTFYPTCKEIMWWLLLYQFYFVLLFILCYWFNIMNCQFYSFHWRRQISWLNWYKSAIMLIFWFSIVH